MFGIAAFAGIIFEQCESVSVFVSTFDQLEGESSEISVSIWQFLRVRSLCARAIFRRGGCYLLLGIRASDE